MLANNNKILVELCLFFGDTYCIYIQRQEQMCLSFKQQRCGLDFLQPIHIRQDFMGMTTFMVVQTPNHVKTAYSYADEYVCNDYFLPYKQIRKLLVCCARFKSSCLYSSYIISKQSISSTPEMI